MTPEQIVKAACDQQRWREAMKQCRAMTQPDKVKRFAELAEQSVPVALLFAKDVGVKAAAMELVVPQVFRMDASDMEKPLRLLASTIGISRLEELFDADGEIAKVTHSPVRYWLSVLRANGASKNH